MIIGSFKLIGVDAGYSGHIRTLTLNHPRVIFSPIERNGQGPDFEVLTQAANGDDPTEIGAAWRRTGKSGEYLSVKLDGPEFSTPINAALIPVCDEDPDMVLVWARKAKAEPVA